MPNVTATCTKCSEEFDPNEHPATKGAALAAGAISGAYIGSGLGIAAGPLGAIAGTIPGAIVDGGAGAMLDKNLAKCPHCRKVQQV